MKYFVVVLFLSSSVFSKSLDLSPPGIANETTSTISCMGSPLLVFALLSIPVVFTVFYFAQYLNIEKRSRYEGKGSFFSDEMVTLMLSSFVIAAVIYLVYLFWQAHGIPVKYLISKYYFCDESGNLKNKCELFLSNSKINILPETCRNIYLSQQRGFQQAFILLLSVGTFIYKLILVFVPVLSAFVLSAKNALGALKDIRERRYGSKLAVVLYFVDSIIIVIAIVFYFNIIYTILLVPWGELVDWFFGNAIKVAVKSLR